MKIKYKRKTKETNIKIKINTKKKGFKIKTGSCFFNHVIEQMCFHGNFKLKIKCKSNKNMDHHHIIEDTGICLGKIFKKIFKKNKERYSFFFLTMEDSISLISIDISNRSYLKFNVNKKKEKILKINLYDIKEFFKAFCENSKTNIYIKSRGKNLHHRIECIFKCFGKTINRLLKLKTNNLKSTK